MSVSRSILGGVGMPVLMATHGIRVTYRPKNGPDFFVRVIWPEDESKVVPSGTGEDEESRATVLVQTTPSRTSPGVASIAVEEDALVKDGKVWLIMEVTREANGVAEVDIVSRAGQRHTGEDYLQR